MITEQVYFHGWFYPFRVHEEKKQNLCFPVLQNFLYLAMTACPHAYFKEGPRSSKLKVALPITLTPVLGHEVSQLAAAALEWSHEKTPHAKVQNFMLERDDKTIAIEVPLWLTPEEMKSYASFFGTTASLTGHIDVLRMEDNKVWVWDFKPHASKEKYAQTQVYFYALMLSLRTGLPMDSFRCGYFDEKVAYLFMPSDKLLLSENTNSFLK